MESKSEYSLNEKDSLQDLLNLEKTMVKVYSTALSEGASKEFIKMMKDNILAVSSDQQKVFSLMTENGYVEVPSAEQTMIKETKNKFNKIKSQLS